MPPHDYERLGILAVKEGVTRQQLLKRALADFLAARAAQYGCACLGACDSNCGEPRWSGTTGNAVWGRSMRYLVMGFAAALTLASVGALAQTPETMAVPADYRQWVFLTASLDLNYTTAAAPDHHMLDNVFVDPEGYAAFQKTGTWPVGTVLIKENRMAQSAGTLSKAGQFQADIMNLEIHIKDGARFAGKWSFFVSDDGKAPGASST